MATDCDCNPTLIKASASPWTCPHGVIWRLGVTGDPYCWTPSSSASGMTRLHYWVAADGYAWPQMTVFLVIRLVEIVMLLFVLWAIIRWGFDV